VSEAALRALSPDDFKQALARWASGVTIVTARHGADVHGMTVSAFSSVSLDPPLVLVCADKASNTNALIQRAGVFSVSVLAQGQEALSNKFASKKEEWRRFDGLACSDGVSGCPRIPGAAVALDCTVEQTVDAGDHFVYIGRVEAVAISDAPPLIHYRAAYRALA
jgi:flavin reductase (DIM6/NTAB) family NADH-FMN oxidoreductase RutF